MCGGIYDIVVFFDFEVLWGVFVLVGGYSLYVTPDRFSVVPEVFEVHVVPLSDEMRMVPLEPTTTCDGLEVVLVVVLLSSLLQEIMERLIKDMRIICKICFILIFY